MLKKLFSRISGLSKRKDILASYKQKMVDTQNLKLAEPTLHGCDISQKEQEILLYKTKKTDL